MLSVLVSACGGKQEEEKATGAGDEKAEQVLIFARGGDSSKP